jgi:hypothetical protein
MQHGWAAAKDHHRQRLLRSEYSSHHASIEETTTAHKIDHPFLLCSSYPDQSGYLRLQRIISTFNTTITNAQTVYNTDETSCFVIVTTTDAVEEAFGEYMETGETRDSRMEHVTFGPLVDVLKFAAGTPSSILDDAAWSNSVVNTKPSLRSGVVNATNEQQQQNWTRSFMVDLIPGSLSGSNTDHGSIENLAEEIINFVSTMAYVKPMPVKQEMNTTKLAMLRYTDMGEILSTPPSTREAFSLTSSTVDIDDMKSRSSSINIWSNALENGFESEHGCVNMFDLIEIRPRGYVDGNTSDESVSVVGFELILNAPQDVNKQDVNSSAWNKHCALSLIIGLSVHPLVQTIEISRTLELASVIGKSNPQWITQSASFNSRPFFDKGLDGSGQVVAVADGGLDRDNCYFRDAYADEESIFGGSWNMTQRKVSLNRGLTHGKHLLDT